MTAVGLVALVTKDEPSRIELARYLERAGFAVHEFEQPLQTSPASHSLVWLTEHDAKPEMVEGTIRAWLATHDQSRVVVVTRRPAALRVARDAHGDRLFVLAPPVFGWQIVDALRDVRGGAA